MTHKDAATQLLVNYFETIAKKAGMPWDRDYTVEIEDAIEHIIQAAQEATLDALKQMEHSR